jgi:hypothetical protein
MGIMEGKEQAGRKGKHASLVLHDKYVAVAVEVADLHGV